MQTVKTINDLKLALYEQLDDASLAMVFLEGDLDASSVIAIRNVEKICDVVVVVWLATLDKPAFSISDNEQKFLVEAGCNILFTPSLDIQKPNSLVKVLVEDKDITFLSQTVLSVMPMVVSCNVANNKLARQLKALEQTFVDMFSFNIKPIPDNLLSIRQQKLRNCLGLAGEMVSSGQHNIKELSRSIKFAIGKENIGLVESIKWLNYGSFKEVKQVLQGDVYLSIKLDNGLIDMVFVKIV